MQSVFPLVPLALVVTTVSPHAAAEPPRPVAIVYSLSGSATLSNPAAEPRPLAFADCLALGDVLTLGSTTHLSIGFVSGRRFTVSGPGRVEIAGDTLLANEARLSELARVPPLPLLPPITDRGPLALRVAAVRVRSQEIPDLRPTEPATTLADETVLHFSPVEGAARYRIEVRGEGGELVYSTITEATRIEIPPGTLTAGASYRWSVRTVERVGPVATGGARFRTLDHETARRRAELAVALAKTEDIEASRLLISVDHGLELDDGDEEDP